ncbi:MAG: HlyD family efflux transporter periplasmic adaptor subunit [Clostridia bacterium]|nr:HlyD family efflux transporter periplasmic adaptor subunit [Clostridia bacterium]
MEAKNRRAWVKNVAIIFLTVLLLLTFFSNTILNHSLPEVSAQYARYDSIAGAIKATGTVKANESFVVTYDEAEEGTEVTTPGQTRKIVSVYVKQGSEVAIGDPILALQGGASKELEEAEKKLRDLEKQYALDQLEDTINELKSDDEKFKNQSSLNKDYKKLAELKELYTILQAGNDPTDALKEQKKAAQKEADNIQKQIDEISKKISETEGKISSAEGNIQEDYTSGLTLEERYTAAKQEYDVLKAEYDALTAKVDTLQAQYDEASGLSGDVAKAYEISQQIHTLNETLRDLEKQIIRNEENSIIAGYEEKKNAYDNAVAALKDFEELYPEGSPEREENRELYSLLEAEKIVSEKSWLDVKDEYDALIEKGYYGDLEYNRTYSDLLEKINETKYQIAEAYAKLDILGIPYIDNLTDYYVNTNTTELKEELDKATKQLTEVTTDYESAKTEYESLSKQMSSTSVITENEALLTVFERDLETYKELLEETKEKVDDIQAQIDDADTKESPEEIKDKIDELTTSISTMEMQMKIDAVTDQKSDTESSYTRADQAKEIEELKADIEAMKNAPSETLVTAPIAGKIVEMNYVPGNSITSGAEVTRIEVAEKGYICEISMSTEEARKIQVGAVCSIVNSWWYSDIDATVTQIRSDPQSQGKNRIVVIELKGDVYEGQSLNFSIGDKSQSYDTVLPNSAIREDSEGKFVLVVESKNTPLSVRYTARRMNIEVIATDDTKSAVSSLYGSEFVITSATSPISDGQQVRLAEN